MKINQLLENAVRSVTTDFLFRNFEKVTSELNFDDDLDGVVDWEEYEYIQVNFKNNWNLTVWNTNNYSLNFSDDENTFGIDICSYDELMEFMEVNSIRKMKQCDYKDAELYVLDFSDK